MVANTDVVIIGAGPAGSTAGALLSRRGRRVVCLERQAFPRFVIGESLLPRCVDLLEAADLLDAVEQRGYMVKHGALFVDGARSSRFDFGDGLAGTRAYTFQVQRDDFDDTLASRASSLGVDLRFCHAVEQVDLGGSRPRVVVRDLDNDDSFALECDFLLDCSGYGRVLPRLLDLEQPSTLSPRTSAFTQVEGDLRPTGREEGDIWICVHENGSWIWIIPFSDGRTSVGVVSDPATFAAAGDTDEARLWWHLRSEPNAAARLHDARQVRDIGVISGYSASVSRLHGEGWALAGNAGPFLDPVFSSGVTLALESASLAADLIDKQLAGEPVDWDRDYASVVVRATDVFDAFVRAWYRGGLLDIFFAGEPTAGIRSAITSVLAGYVLDPMNSLVRDPIRRLETLHGVATRG